MDVVPYLPADSQSAEPAQKCEGRFDDPAVPAQTASVPGATPGDERADADAEAQLTDLAAVDVVVVTAVGIEDVGALTGYPLDSLLGRVGSKSVMPSANGAVEKL